MTEKLADKALQVIENNNQKPEQVSFSKLKYQLQQASLEKKLGNFTKKHAKALVHMEDAFFKSFLNGTSGVKRVSTKMRYVLLQSYDRMNNRNYKLALNGKITFTKGAQIAVKVIQKITHELTRASLVNILVRFFRFVEIEDTSDTYDELYMYNDEVHIYQPALNALDKKIHDIYNDFGYGLLKLHHIVRLVEVNKYTKHINIDSIKHYPYLVACNNGIYDRKCNRFLKFSPNYFITNKLKANYPSKTTLDKIKHTTVEQALKYGGTDKEIGANPTILNMTIPEYMHYFFTMITSSNSKMKHQLYQEILDAIEPYYSHESIVLNYGKTHTAKSEFMMIIRGIIGDSKYASMSINQLQEKSALSTVVNKYAVLGDDLTEQIQIKDDSNVLKMARGANIYTEAKYKQGHTSTLKQAIINNLNKFPKTASKGPWVNNRILVVLFKHHFVQDKKNPYYFSDDWIQVLFGTPQVSSYMLYLTLHQPRFSRYIVTADSKRMGHIFANQNNPVQLFCNKIMQAPKNRLVKKVVYQQFIQFSREYGFSPKYKKMSFSDFNDSFKTCMPKCTTAQERLSKAQVRNQEIINDQFQLRIGRYNSDGDIIQYYIQPLDPGHRYTCYVFPSIPNNIVDCDIDGIIFSLLPDDEVKFPKVRWFEVGEHNADAEALHKCHLLNKGIDGAMLAQFMMNVNTEGYAKACKDYGFNAKKDYFKMLKISAYIRSAHKSYVANHQERSNSTWTDLQYRIREGFKHDKEAKKDSKAKAMKNIGMKEQAFDKKIMKQLKNNQQKKNKSKANKSKSKSKPKSKSLANVHVELEPKVYTSSNGTYVIDSNKIDWFLLDKIKELKPKTFIIKMKRTNHGIIAHTNHGIELKLNDNNRKQFDKIIKSISNGDGNND